VEEGVNGRKEGFGIDPKYLRHGARNQEWNWVFKVGPCYVWWVTYLEVKALAKPV